MCNFFLNNLCVIGSRLYSLSYWAVPVELGKCMVWEAFEDDSNVTSGVSGGRAL